MIMDCDWCDLMADIRGLLKADSMMLNTLVDQSIFLALFALPLFRRFQSCLNVSQKDVLYQQAYCSAVQTILNLVCECLMSYLLQPFLLSL